MTATLGKDGHMSEIRKTTAATTTADATTTSADAASSATIEAATMSSQTTDGAICFATLRGVGR